MWLAAITLCLMVWAAIGFAIAQAHVGVAHGVGPRLSNPATPHIGPVYYTPGDGSHHSASAIQKAESLPALMHKLNCDYLRMRYALRHGITTPKPLRGMHGCAKAAHDQRYWKARRHEPVTPNIHQAQALESLIKADVLSFNQLF